MNRIPEDMQESLASQVQNETKEAKTSSILYVDDEESNLRIFKSSFRRHYKIHIANSGKTGLEVLENNDIQLVISDQRMPEMTGVEFLEKVAARYPQTVRIILTAYSDTEDIMYAINRCGIFRYLVKPWNKEEMLLTIDKALETYYLRTENKQLVDALKKSNEDLESKVKERTADLIKSNESLKKAKEQAEAATKTKEQFLSTMSHEIRTPLNAIIGMTHLLKQANMRGEMQENVEILEFSAQNLLSLINSILDLSKMEAGKMAFEQSEFDVGHTILSLVEAFRGRADEKNIHIKASIDKSVPEVLLGDPTKLSQILNNLIGNAIKFTNEGTVTISVRVLSQQAESVELLFAVSDTGIGIPSDKIDSIFESFAQAETTTSRKYGGTGLGLAITKQLIELQGGAINVMSTPMVGSTFSFQLSFDVARNKSLKVELPQPTEVRSLKGVKILIVEDNKVNQILTRKFLSNWGAEHKVAENGQVAIERVKEESFDLILMDLQMPVMNGYEATVRIREMEKDTNNFVPIIALTASTLLNERERIVKVGMNDFLSKPFDPENLYKKIAQHTTSSAQPVFNGINTAPKALDYSYFENLAGADKKFYTELLKLSKAELEDFRKVLTHAELSDYNTQLAISHHKIRATLHLFSLKEFEKRINQYRRMVITSTDEPLKKSFFDSIEQEISRVIREIQDKIQRL